MRRKKLVKLRIDEVSSVSVGSGHECRVVLMKRQDDKHKNGLSQMEQMRKVVTDEEREFLSSWVNSMSPDLRRRLAELVAEAERQERSTLVTGSTPGADVHGNSGQGELSAAEGYGRQTKAASLQDIAKRHGVSALANMIVADKDAHRITESELVELAKKEAEGKGKSVGELLLSDAVLQKACAIARDGEYAREAERNVLDAAVRSRMAQLSN